MRSEVAVVVLAGGEGKRIGGGKPLKRLSEERLIDRALRTARTWSGLVAVAVRDTAQIERVNAPVITDEPNIDGPLGGLVSALRFAAKSDCEFLLTIPTDMPFLPPDLAGRLMSGIGDLACAMAASGGHVHPVCGLWRTSCLDWVGSYLAGERRSLRGFGELVGCSDVEWPSQPLDAFLNINTADELAEAAHRAKD